MSLTDNAHFAGSLFNDPRWFPEGFDARRGAFRFVATDRAALAAQTFLDERWERSGLEKRHADTAALAACAPAETPKPTFIWHTGFCCSTLLARALDRPGYNLSLCEPWVLVEVAEAKRAGAFARTSFAAVPRIAFHLLARRFAPGERITLKPSPAANNLLQEAAAQTAAPMLFLYSDCRSFLISTCRLGEGGRKYVRTRFLALLNDSQPQMKWPVAKMLYQTDLELAAIVWHMQIAEFRRAWSLMGPARAASLDCDAFLASPVDALHRIDDLFSLGLGKDHMTQIVSGPLFRRNAKTGEEAFDAARRREEHAIIERQMARDLDRIVAESYALCGTAHGAPLPDPLLPTDKAYSP